MPESLKKFAMGLLLAVASGASGLSAQEAPATPDPEADLAAIIAKAADDRQVRRTLDQLIEMARGNSGFNADEQIAQVILGNSGARPDRTSLPLDVKLVGAIPLAERRAQVLMEIMTADLNGDWAVSRDELSAIVGARNTQRAAEVFIEGDADRDNMLTQDELRAIVAKIAERETGERVRQPNFLVLFDFDDDGMLTSDELDRAIVALRS